MALKAVIFDIDGVLVDSREAVSYNTECLLKEFGFDVPYEKITKMSSAHSAETVLLSLVPSLSEDKGVLERMLARLAELTRENISMVKPTSLASKIPALALRYKLAAASNRKESARLVLEYIGIKEYFGAILTSRDAPPKPNPKMITLALSKLGVPAQEAIFIGDNLEDVMAGTAANVRTLMFDGTKESEYAKLKGVLEGL